MGNNQGGDNWTPSIAGDYRLDHDGAGASPALQEELSRLRAIWHAAYKALRNGHVSDAMADIERGGRILGNCYELAGMDE